MEKHTNNPVLNNLRDFGAASRVIWDDLCHYIALVPWRKMILVCAIGLVVVPVFALPTFLILLIFIALGIKITMPRETSSPEESTDSDNGREDEQPG